MGCKRYYDTSKEEIVLETYLVIYDFNDDPMFEIQRVEGYWDLQFQWEPIKVIKITKRMVEELNELDWPKY